MCTHGGGEGSIKDRKKLADFLYGWSHTHCVLLENYYSVDFAWWFDRNINDKNSTLHLAIWQKSASIQFRQRPNLQIYLEAKRMDGYSLEKRILLYSFLFYFFFRLSCFPYEWLALIKMLMIFKTSSQKAHQNLSRLWNVDSWGHSWWKRLKLFGLHINL